MIENHTGIPRAWDLNKLIILALRNSIISSLVGSMDKMMLTILDCRRMGLKVLPPDVNFSSTDFSVVEGEVRFGLGAVKNVGIPAVEEIHPLSTFLRPWYAAGTPDMSVLNAAARERGLVTGSGAALSFVLPSVGAEAYEEHAFLTGEIATRAGNPHDLFNALIWLAFPRTKAAFNRRHVAALNQARQRGSAVRGPLRDALTQFDECGVIVAGSCPDLWSALRAHRWREVFVSRREELLRTTRFLVFGHASHDALAAPFVGLCGKALFVDVDETWLDLPEEEALAALDERLAMLFDTRSFSPRDWQPLPLLGIPGATADNERPDYYDDRRQFRAARTMRSGSSPGNR